MGMNFVIGPCHCQMGEKPNYDQMVSCVSAGYIVFSGVRRSSGIQGLRMIVQSDKSPEYVENRIEAFLKHMEVNSNCPRKKTNVPYFRYPNEQCHCRV